MISGLSGDWDVRSATATKPSLPARCGNVGPGHLIGWLFSELPPSAES